MLLIDAELALIVLIPLPLVSVAAWAYSKRYDARTRRLQEAWAETATLVEETVSGIRVVKGLGAGALSRAVSGSAATTIVRRALDIARLDAVFIPALEVLPAAGDRVGALVRRPARDRRRAQPRLLRCLQRLRRHLVWPLRVLGQRVTTLQKAIAASARITEVLEAEPRLKDPSHPRSAGPAPERGRSPRRCPLRTRGRARRARRADLHLAPGESLALVGADRLRQEHRRGLDRPALRPR